MTEKPPLTSDRNAADYPDWATLMDRALDNISRILRSEIHMFQTSMEAALEAQIDNAVMRLTSIIAMVCGAICILCALILLLHQWLPWWQSFGIAGLVALTAGIVSHASVKSSGRLAAPTRE